MFVEFNRILNNEIVTKKRMLLTNFHLNTASNCFLYLINKTQLEHDRIVINKFPLSINKSNLQSKIILHSKTISKTKPCNIELQ